MLKFNNTHIITGYIKQLLANFNLPKFRVYTKEHQKYHDEAVEKGLKRTESPEIIETVKRAQNKIDPGSGIFTGFKDHLYYANYIRHGKVQRYICSYDKDNNFIEGHWEDTKYHFHYNKPMLNKTKTLTLKSNIYDSHTHEYLGNFLRFLRDYNDINLMPLYNCFSDTICTNLNIEFDYLYIDESEEETKKTKTSTILFDTSDPKYKIYMLPVKLFKEYTIAIDSDLPVEICCGFFGKYQDLRSKVRSIYGTTYQRYSNLSFRSPILYRKLTTEVLSTLEVKYAEMAQIEDTLKMFIKVPVDNNSSVVVLEGNYTNYNQEIINSNWDTKIVDDSVVLKYNTSNVRVRKQNKAITNWETNIVNNKVFPNIVTALPQINDRDFNPITKLQLLEINTNFQHPFADRLIEYLVGNTIDNQDENIDNIKRAQTVMSENGLSFSTFGAWENKMKNIVYDYMNSKHPDNSIAGISSLANHDCLGYIDKDVEKYYTSWVPKPVLNKYGEIKKDEEGNVITEKVSVNTISGVDLYAGIYEDD